MGIPNQTMLLEEFSFNNFSNISQCMALTWNNGNPKQCKGMASIGKFCKIHSKIENKECKHCLTHCKKRIRHKYRWECLGTIDNKNNTENNIVNIPLDDFIKRKFDPMEDSEYDEIEYEDLLRLITCEYTHIDQKVIRNSLDSYIENRT